MMQIHVNNKWEGEGRAAKFYLALEHSIGQLNEYTDHQNQMPLLHHGIFRKIRAYTRLPVRADEWENAESASIMGVFSVKRGLLA